MSFCEGELIMFEKATFKIQLEKLINERTTTQFSEETGFNRTYLSKYLNLKLNRPPSPHLLKAIAGPEVSYEELMITCGYLDKNNKCNNSIKIPIMCGKFINEIPIPLESIKNYESISSPELSPNHSYFYLEVEDDSMVNARICKGDLALVKIQKEIKSGDIGVVKWNGQVVIKRILKKEDYLILQSESSENSPEILPLSEILKLEIIGKVLYVKFKP